MTNTSREAVERLLQDVTPGPWAFNTLGEFGPMSQEDDQSFGMICEPSGECFLPNRLSNARFIAASRELVPALLARAEAAEAKLAKAVEALTQISQVELTFLEELRPTASAALAEINGESHD